MREGPNTIVVQAADLAGNTGSDELQVTYDPSAVGNVNLCENVPVSDTLQKTIPQMALPAYLSRVAEPTFGTTMIRISDALPDGVIKPMYNTIQAWNADESRMILYHTGTEGNGHHIYDGNTYEHIKRLNITPGDIEQVFWDFNDPDIFYYIHNNRGDANLFSHLVRYDITDDSRTPIKDFSSVCDEDAGVVGGSDIQMMSWDSNVIGVMCRRENKSWYYDIQNDVNGPVLTIGDGTVFNERPAIMPAPSGDYFYHSGYILDRDMEIAVQLDAASAFEHNSFGRTVDGRDAYFALAFAASPNGCDGGGDRGAGHLVLHDVESGACRVIIGRSLGYDTPSISGTHITALSYRNPGWAALSTIDLANIANADNFTSGQPAPLFFSEIYLANTDPANPVTCRLAHHRSYGKAATVGAYNGYFAEPHLGLSPSGTRILFGSDWYDSGSVNTFVIELPVHQP